MRVRDVHNQPIMPKKKAEEVEEIEEVEVVEEVVIEPAFNEMEEMKKRQAILLSLRDNMVSEGLTDISKLDSKLGEVNERIRQLEL